MAYQSFGNEVASSDSHGKLSALRLDKLRRRGADLALRGFRVLDIGCNEGFFCVEAIKLGAASVIGIDKSARAISEARKRCPEGKFIEGSWWDLPDQKFDLILFLSALHYEPREKELFDHLAEYLSPDGTLILECGIIRSGSNLRGWRQVQRGDGPKRYALYDFLIEDILDKYAIRPMGGSVLQKGDSVPRHVFHCKLRKPTAVLIQAGSLRHRPDLSNILAAKSLPVHPADDLVSRLTAGAEPYAFAAFAKLRAQQFPARPVSLACRYIASEGLAEDLAELIAAECPSDAEMFIVDGECLTYPQIFHEVQLALQNRGVICWKIADPA